MDLDPPWPLTVAAAGGRGQGSTPGITLNSEWDDYSTCQQWGRLLARESQAPVRWTTDQMQPCLGREAERVEMEYWKVW